MFDLPSPFSKKKAAPKAKVRNIFEKNAWDPGQPRSVDPAAAAWSAPETEGICFPVDAVAPADRALFTESLEDSLNRRFRRKILVLPSAGQPVVNAEIDTWRNSKHFPRGAEGMVEYEGGMGSRCHPLIDAVHDAFSRHYPLTLSPDCIWLTIAQGFGHHVTENADALRGRLVRHQGRHELTAEVNSLSVAAFEKATADFSAQVRDATDPVLHETLICDFTTTAPASRTASEVVLMDTFSSYFTYVMMCVCGIPKITITGTAEDWLRIRARVEVLETFDLEWWVGRLRPILDEFVAAASGQPNAGFWQAIYKPKDVYAATLATGWITDLFPYLGDAPDRRRNPVLQQERDRMAVQRESGVSLNRFPSGISSVPMEIRIPKKTGKPVDLVAGFFGVKQERRDLALTPVIGWAVTEPAPDEPVELLG